MALHEYAGQVALEALALFLALLLARRAWRGRRIAPGRPLLWFSVGFALLALAQAAAIALEIFAARTPVLATRRLDHFDVLFWTYYAGWIAGASFLLATFDRRKLRLVLALGPVMLIAGPLLQVALVVLLMLIAIHAGLNHIQRSNAGSRLTTGGYFLLLAGQFLNVQDYDPLTPQSTWGLACTIAGLLLLIWASRAGQKGSE